MVKLGFRTQFWTSIITKPHHNLLQQCYQIRRQKTRLKSWRFLKSFVDFVQGYERTSTFFQNQNNNNKRKKVWNEKSIWRDFYPEFINKMTDFHLKANISYLEPSVIEQFAVGKFEKFCTIWRKKSDFTHTVLKFHDVSVTQIIGEINSGEYKSSKSVIFANLQFLQFVNLEILTF